MQTYWTPQRVEESIHKEVRVRDHCLQINIVLEKTDHTEYYFLV